MGLWSNATAWHATRAVRCINGITANEELLTGDNSGFIFGVACDPGLDHSPIDNFAVAFEH
jgi:hypothetical protein